MRRDYPDPPIARLAELFAAYLDRHFGSADLDDINLEASAEDILFGDRPVWVFLRERLITEREARDLLLGRLLDHCRFTLHDERYAFLSAAAMDDNAEFDLVLFGGPAEDL